MYILSSVIFIVLWIYWLKRAIALSSDESISKEINEMRKIKIVYLNELEDKLDSHLITKEEYKKAIDLVLSATNISRLDENISIANSFYDKC